LTFRNGLNGFWFALPLDLLAGAPDATFYGGACSSRGESLYFGSLAAAE
jgi:hypothetical protein